MVIFHSYVSLPEGNPVEIPIDGDSISIFQWDLSNVHADLLGFHDDLMGVYHDIPPVMWRAAENFPNYMEV